MSKGSTRGARGWFYAILVAVCLFSLFTLSNSYLKLGRPNYRDPRTTFLKVATSSSPKARTTADSLPVIVTDEPLDQLVEDASWADYRQQAVHSISLFAPPATGTLFGPTSPSFETLDEGSPYGRNPESLAASVANQNQVAATLVSTSSEPKAQVAAPSRIDRPKSSPLIRKTWPEPRQLRESIDRCMALDDEQRAEVSTTLGDLSNIVDQLSQHDLKSSSVTELLNRFRELGREIARVAGESVNDKQALSSELARLAYSIERRAAVWMAIHDCVNRGPSGVSVRLHDIDYESLESRIIAVENLIKRTGQVAFWKQFLLLDKLRGLEPRANLEQDEKVHIARQFLSNFLSTNVTQAQKEILASPDVRRLADLVHPWTIGPVDYVQLLDDIETLESNPTHRCSASLSQAVQTLRFSELAEQAAISQAITSHYRNANIRIAISEEFVNRMLPKGAIAEKPVRQTIMGADTRGASLVKTQLQADFQTDNQGWTISLNLEGDVNSQTRSSRNGATFYSQSIANVNAARQIRIRPSGFEINGSPASVHSNDSLRKFSTDWDGLPVLGDIVRNIARNEFLEARPIARRITQNTIARETDREFDSQLQNKLKETQGQLETRLLGPLQGLDLNPMIMDLQSTDERLIVRYRVASDCQMSANTARPIAPSDSVLSMQIHQTALNNIATQVVTSGRDWTAQELADQIATILRQPKQDIELEQGEDVRVRFQPNNPVTVDFQDGRLWLTLRVDSLEQPGRLLLKNFTIRAAYVPVVRGLWAGLEREGPVSVEGPKMTAKDRLPLRTIFTKVLSNQEAIPMVAESLLKNERAVGLAVSQMVLRDGWIGIAVSKADSPHIPILKEQLARIQPIDE
jgi:hypothetical protein